MHPDIWPLFQIAVDIYIYLYIHKFIHIDMWIEGVQPGIGTKAQDAPTASCLAYLIPLKIGHLFFFTAWFYPPSGGLPVGTGHPRWPT